MSARYANGLQPARSPARPPAPKLVALVHTLVPRTLFLMEAFLRPGSDRARARARPRHQTTNMAACLDPFRLSERDCQPAGVPEMGFHFVKMICESDSMLCAQTLARSLEASNSPSILKFDPGRTDTRPQIQPYNALRNTLHPIPLYSIIRPGIQLAWIELPSLFGLHRCGGRTRLHCHQLASC